MTENEKLFIFMHENQMFKLTKEEMVFMNDKCFKKGEDRIYHIDPKFKHNHICELFEFVKNGIVPNKKEDQLQIIEILRDFGCHFTIFDSFRHRIQSLSNNGMICHKEILYGINTKYFCSQSSVFREFYIQCPNEVFQINYECCSQVIEIFLDLIHDKIHQLPNEFYDDVMGLCRFLGCNSLFIEPNDNSFESVLSIFIENMNNDFFDTSHLEEIISSNLESFIKLNDLCKVHYPHICRFFQRSKLIFEISTLVQFFQRYVEIHGICGFLILFHIHCRFNNNITVFNDFFSCIYCNYKENVFYQHYCLYEDHNTQYENLKSLIGELKRNQEKIQSVNQNLNEEITRLKNCIENDNKELIIKDQGNQNKIKELEKEKSTKFEGFMSEIKKKDHEICLLVKEKNDFGLKVEELKEEIKKKEQQINQINNEALIKAKEQKTRIEHLEREKSLLDSQYKQELYNKKQAEDERKKNDEFERITQWKTKKPLDHYSNIFEAIKRGHFQSVIHLIANGTNLNLTCSSSNDCAPGSLAQHYAARFGYHQILEYLIKYDVDINKTNENKETPLHIAASYGHIRVVECLINNGAEKNARNGSVEFLYLIGLLFTTQPLMVILVLLNS